MCKFFDPVFGIWFPFNLNEKMSPAFLDQIALFVFCVLIPPAPSQTATMSHSDEDVVLPADSPEKDSEGKKKRLRKMNFSSGSSVRFVC